MPSGNVTAAIDNLTTVLTGSPAAITAVATALTLMVTALQLSAFFELFLLLGMVYLSFSRGDMILQIVSGLVTFFIALLWFEDYTGISFVLIGLSAYQLIWQSLIPAVTGSGPSRGWSQFKALYYKVRGREE